MSCPFQAFLLSILEERRRQNEEKSLSSSQYGIHFNYLADCCLSLENTAFILPGPAAVFSALTADAQVLLSHSVTTLNEAVIGLAIASVLSFITALAMDYWKFLEMSFYPLLVISQMLPIMVLGPLLTLWFGFGMLPKVILVVLISYFPIVVSFRIH